MQILETGFKFWFWPPLAVCMWEIWVSKLSLSLFFIWRMWLLISALVVIKLTSTWQTVNERQLSVCTIKSWRLGSQLHGPTEHFPEVSHLMCQNLRFTLFSSFLPQCVASPSLTPETVRVLGINLCASFPFSPSALHLRGLPNHLSSVFTGTNRSQIFICCLHKWQADS